MYIITTNFGKYIIMSEGSRSRASSFSSTGPGSVIDRVGNSLISAVIIPSSIGISFRTVLDGIKKKTGEYSDLYPYIIEAARQINTPGVSPQDVINNIFIILNDHDIQLLHLKNTSVWYNVVAVLLSSALTLDPSFVTLIESKIDLRGNLHSEGANLSDKLAEVFTIARLIFKEEKDSGITLPAVVKQNIITNMCSLLSVGLQFKPPVGEERSENELVFLATMLVLDDPGLFKCYIHDYETDSQIANAMINNGAINILKREYNRVPRPSYWEELRPYSNAGEILGFIERIVKSGSIEMVEFASTHISTNIDIFRHFKFFQDRVLIRAIESGNPKIVQFFFNNEERMGDLRDIVQANRYMDAALESNSADMIMYINSLLPTPMSFKNIMKDDRGRKMSVNTFKKLVARLNVNITIGFIEGTLLRIKAYDIVQYVIETYPNLDYHEIRRELMSAGIRVPGSN